VPNEEYQTFVALAAIVLWPVASLCIFAFTKTFSRGLIWSVLAAQLLLPVGALIKFQMVPIIDKVSVANLGALIGYLIFSRQKAARRSRSFGLVEILLLCNIASPIITSELNSDHVIIGNRFLTGVGLYDALSAVQATLILLIPFMLGRWCLRTAEDCHNTLVILAIAGLCYSVPLLFEIRFSPQLHFWVYGYYPTDFVQTMREGGFRPMVFMGHGLLASFFLMTSLLATIALWRNRINIGPIKSSITIPYLGLVLVLCKSLGALIYSAAGFFVFFGSPRAILRVAAILVTISMAYPLLRSFDLIPTTVIVDVAKSIDKDRAESLEFRLKNEDALIERAFERPLFGWGRFGRSRIYDPDSGRDLSVTDGRWVIDIGQFGLFGFLCEFGLLGVSVFRAAATYRLARSASEQLAMATLALILAINIFDLLPNAGLIPWTWLISGALLGQTEALTARAASRSSARPAGAISTSTPSFGSSPDPMKSNRMIELD
jgi:hypothetical protein